MTDGSGHARVRRLVESLLSAAGVPYAWCGEVLQANLSQEAMTSLQGHWAPAGTLRLVFDPEVAAAHPEADLVAPGSFRLERFLAWIRRQVQLARAYLPPLPRGTSEELFHRCVAAGLQDSPMGSRYLLGQQQIWEPHLVIPFLAARIGVERQETLHVPGVNLVTGTVCDDLRPFLPQEGGAPPGPEARRRLTYRRGYEALVTSVVRRIREEDASWAETALRHYQEEVERLMSYFDELAQENRGQPDTLAQLETVRQHRLHEQRDRFRPRVLIRPLAVALLYVPALTISVLLCDGLHERRRTFTYDSLLGRFRLPGEPPAPPPGPPPQTRLILPPESAPLPGLAAQRWPS